MSAVQCDSRRADLANTTAQEHADWLREFKNRHGRPPAVLHIGNIANNAYVLSKMLNTKGIISDVLCHDYYHIMGCPEWEDAEFVGDIGDQNFPAWENVDLRGFTRPDWFVQGPVGACLEYLIARRSGNVSAARRQGRRLDQARLSHCVAARENQGGSPISFLQRCHARGCRVARRWISKFQALPLRLFGQAQTRPSYSEAVSELIERYRQSCPERQDTLSSHDLPIEASTFELWRDALSAYDLIVGFSTDGIYPLIVGRPYFCFEP